MLHSSVRQSKSRYLDAQPKTNVGSRLQGGPKTDTHFYSWDNFGNSAPILTILSLLKAEIYDA